MKEPSEHDPRLQAFEARLAALAPLVSLDEQQQLLYQCGFAAGQRAGQQAGRRSLRRWQAVAAAVVLALGWLTLGGNVARERGEPTLAVVPEPSPPAEVVFPRMPAEVEPRPAAQQAVSLDAWQSPATERESLAEELDHFRQTAPELRALAVSELTRAVLAP